MNADPHARLGKPSVTLKLSPDDEIRELSGDVEGLFGVSSVELWRKPLNAAFPKDVAGAMGRVALGIRQGGDEPQICGDGHGGEFMLVGRPTGRDEPGGVVLFVYRLSGEADWWEREEVEARADGQADRDDFLDEAALAMKGEDGASVTMLSVHGGLDPVKDGQMSRIVEDQARRGGARRTTRFDNAMYGILHDRDHDAGAMLDAISGAAAAGGVIADKGAIGAEQIEADTRDLDPEVIRATLSHSSRGLRDRVSAGLRRFGLSRKHDEAKTETAKLIVAVRKALQDGPMFVEARPIASLRKSAVAMRQVRAHPMVDGRRLDADVLVALGEQPSLAVDMDLATIRKALDAHQDWKVWRGVSLRVMASVHADMLRDEDRVRKIARLVRGHEASANRLILRPQTRLGGKLTGLGDMFLENPGESDWRIAVPDFYAFVKGEVALDCDGVARSDPSAYIEVAADRLNGLVGQKDGRFLVRTLLKTWRSQGTEVIATSVDHAQQFEMLDDLGVRYAKGAKVGDWAAN